MTTPKRADVEFCAGSGQVVRTKAVAGKAHVSKAYCPICVAPFGALIRKHGLGEIPDHEADKPKPGIIRTYEHPHGEGKNAYPCRAACHVPVKLKHRWSGAPFVECDEHGVSEITDEDYGRQIRNPDARWTCPVCGDITEWRGTRSYE